jgi:hypothetical protein
MNGAEVSFPRRREFELNSPVGVDKRRRLLWACAAHQRYCSQT